MKPLNARQQRFVEEYLKDLNASDAARRAGYSAKTARVMGSENLTKPAIQSAIAAALAERSKATRIDAEYVLTTIRDTVERCRQAEPVLDRDGDPTGEYRFDASSVLKGSELLGKHLGLFIDRHEIKGDTFGLIIHKTIPEASNVEPTKPATDDASGDGPGAKAGKD